MEGVALNRNVQEEFGEFDEIRIGVLVQVQLLVVVSVERVVTPHTAAVDVIMHEINGQHHFQLEVEQTQYLQFHGPQRSDSVLSVQRPAEPS